MHIRPARDLVHDVNQQEAMPGKPASPTAEPARRSRARGEGAATAPRCPGRSSCRRLAVRTPHTCWNLASTTTSGKPLTRDALQPVPKTVYLAWLVCV